MAPGRAAAWGLAAGAVLGFCVALRAAPLIAAATFLVLWRGIGARSLITAAGLLLVVAVPVLTVAIPVENRGGFNTEYAQDRIAVHWVTQAALVLLWLAAGRLLAGLSTARGRRARAPGARRPAGARPARAP